MHLTCLWEIKKRAYIVTVVESNNPYDCQLGGRPRARPSGAASGRQPYAPSGDYYSDGLPGYQALVYGLNATHTAVLDKSQTYRVEGGNADLRNYLARFVHRSRCFSRCITALRRAVKLWVWCYNQGKLWDRRYPHYPKQVIDFVPPS